LLSVKARPKSKRHARVSGGRYFLPKRRIKLLPRRFGETIWNRKPKGCHYSASLRYCLYQCLKEARRYYRNLGRIRFLRYLFRSEIDQKRWTDADWSASNAIFGLCHLMTRGKYTLVFNKHRDNSQSGGRKPHPASRDPKYGRSIKRIRPSSRSLFVRELFDFPKFISISDLRRDYPSVSLTSQLYVLYRR
jgi:hypothetical protein